MDTKLWKCKLWFLTSNIRNNCYNVYIKMKKKEIDPFEILPLPKIYDLELAKKLVAVGYVHSLKEIYEPASKEKKLNLSKFFRHKKKSKSVLYGSGSSSSSISILSSPYKNFE